MHFIRECHDKLALQCILECIYFKIIQYKNVKETTKTLQVAFIGFIDCIPNERVKKRAHHVTIHFATICNVILLTRIFFLLRIFLFIDLLPYLQLATQEKMWQANKIAFISMNKKGEKTVRFQLNFIYLLGKSLWLKAGFYIVLSKFFCDHFSFC